MNLEIKKRNNVRAEVCTFFFDINSIKHNKGEKSMKKIRIDGREYNVSKKVYEYIKGVSAEKRLYKQ